MKGPFSHFCFFFWFVCFYSCNDTLQRKKCVWTFSSITAFELLLLQKSPCKVGTERTERFQNVPSGNLYNCWHKYLRENGPHWPSSIKLWSTPLPEGKRKLLSILKECLGLLLKHNILSFIGQNWLLLHHACWVGRPCRELEGFYPTVAGWESHC